MEYYDINGNVQELSVDNRSVNIDGVPCLHILGTLPTSKDDGNLKVAYIFSNGTERFNGYATLKVQGNTTALFPKKNFTIKLFSDKKCKKKYKVSFNDWGKQNKFVLKADWIDISHARNIVSARLWSDVVASRDSYDSLPELYKTSINNCQIDGFLIKVFVNGVYYGRYSWNIPKDAYMFNMDEDNPEHCAICSENYVSGCFRAPARLDESDWTDEIHEAVPTAIITRWNEVISFVMTSTDAEFIENIGTYINLDSLIDYYIFAYVDCGLDALGKNQIYLTYDGNVWYASMYDMDSTWGLYWSGAAFVSAEYRMQEDYEVGKQGTSNLLFDRLEALFPTEIKDRYAELRAGVLSARYIKDRFKEWCDLSSAEFMALDYAPETADGAFVDMTPNTRTTNNYTQISNFVDARLTYVDAQINTLE